MHKDKKTLDEKPLNFERLREGEPPLCFPGKVLADAASKRLFIADSTHHRIVITDLDGKKIAVAGVGTAGQGGWSFAEAPSTIRRAWPSRATRFTSPTARTT